MAEKTVSKGFGYSKIFADKKTSQDMYKPHDVTLYMTDEDYSYLQVIFRWFNQKTIEQGINYIVDKIIEAETIEHIQNGPTIEYTKKVHIKSPIVVPRDFFDKFDQIYSDEYYQKAREKKKEKHPNVEPRWYKEKRDDPDKSLERQAYDAISDMYKDLYHQGLHYLPIDKMSENLLLEISLCENDDREILPDSLESIISEYYRDDDKKSELPALENAYVEITNVFTEYFKRGVSYQNLHKMHTNLLVDWWLL